MRVQMICLADPATIATDDRNNGARVPRREESPAMSVQQRNYEQKLQETRLERQAEEKRVERLSEILAKKINSFSSKLPDRGA
jgi:hypothetical protein